MPTRNVVLTDHQAALLDRLVASGRYQNASEAMREGLRRLEEDEARMEALVARLTEGYQQALDGKLAEGTAEEVINRAFDNARRKRRDAS